MIWRGNPAIKDGLESVIPLQPEERVTINLEIQVWGMAANGHAFSQAARTHDVSASGAMLSDIEHELKTGDIIGVRFGEKKTRCKVVWTKNSGSVHKIQVGVELLKKAECPWADRLSKAMRRQDTGEPGRRRWVRHKIAFPIALYDEQTPVRVSATDISGSGCYVEMLSPFAAGTGLGAELWMGTERLTTRALVRTCDPRVGMGIEFVGLSSENQKRFQDYLQAIDPFSCSIEHQARALN